jgi:hypothetical protein
MARLKMRTGKMKIINITQHPATAEQVAAGVIDVPAENLTELRALITFDALPTVEEIETRARAVAALVKRLNIAGVKYAMIGGALYFMGALERALADISICPIYAFSVRNTVEEVLSNGDIKKTQIFQHGGFVYPCGDWWRK